VVGLSGFGLEIQDRIPLEASVNDENRNYLITKKLRMGHLLGNC
jgi:3,4-dihydroxy 2-butanone 4-phosphate synthase/GTP cyclohydrolase II